MVKILSNFTFFIKSENRSKFFVLGDKYSIEEFKNFVHNDFDFLLRNGYIELIEEGQQLQFEAKQYNFSTEFATEKNLEEKLYTEQEILELGLDKSFEELLQEQALYETKVIKEEKKAKKAKQ